MYIKGACVDEKICKRSVSGDIGFEEKIIVTHVEFVHHANSSNYTNIPLPCVLCAQSHSVNCCCVAQLLLRSTIVQDFCLFPNHFSCHRDADTRTDEDIRPDGAIGEIVGERCLDINLSKVNIQLAVIVFVMFGTHAQTYWEVVYLVVQLQVTHGIISFEADGHAFVEHAFNREAANNTEVKRLVVFGFCPAKVEPISRGDAANEADVVFGFR